MDPAAAADPDADPLLNLSNLRSRMDTVHRILSDSLTTNTVISNTQMNIISDEITAAINAVIVTGTSLITSGPKKLTEFQQSDLSFNNFNNEVDLGFPKTETVEEQIEDDLGIVELDAVELLAEHLHFCDICGKGFKRDANLRMHMRAHGNKFKTLEALSKPEKSVTNSDTNSVRTTRFSCPFIGCNRNKMHKKFRPLKSVICVKNHFKRSHCPKMYSCNRCHKKNFSVLADLKSHLKHCGEMKWKCSCGTSFSRKDKLFGHIALFEGHMPAMPAAEVAVEDDGKGKGAVAPPPVVENVDWVDNDMIFDGLGSIDDDFFLQDILGAGSVDWNL